MTSFELRFLRLYQWFEENRITLYRFLVVAGLLMIGALLIPRLLLGNRNLALLLAAGLFLVVVIVLLRWPILGIISIFIGGMFIPFIGPSGLNAVVGVIALMLMVWLIKMMMEERQVRLILSRATIPVYIFIIISIVAFVIGQLPWYIFAQKAPIDTQIGGLSIFILSAGAFLLAAHLVKNLRELKLMTWVLIITGIIYVLGRALDWGYIDRIFHNGYIAQSMFWTWLIAMMFGQVAYNSDLRIRWRILLAVMLAISLYVALIKNYDWKSGWIPPMVAVAAILAFRFWKPVFFFVPLVFIPAYYVVNQLISGESYSWGTRVDAWAVVLDILKANPLLGFGFGNYYWITPLFRIRGYAIRFNSHNQYLDILAQTGLLGLICFLWILWEAGRFAWRLREKVPSGFPRAYVYGTLGGIAGTLVACMLVDWVLPFVYNIGFNGFRASVLPWLFLGGLVSLNQLYEMRS